MKLSYLSYFFTYETHIPDGIGFALFGPWHLLWLSVIFAICVRYVWIYKKGDESKKRRMDGLTACSLVVWIVVRAKETGKQFAEESSYLRWQDRDANKKFFSGEIVTFTNEAARLLTEMKILHKTPDINTLYDAKYVTQP